jgi:molybdate/tungstate transport system permease protein
MMNSSMIDSFRKNRWFTGMFVFAGLLLIIFVLLPVLSTIADTHWMSLWQAVIDPEVQSALGVTFVAALWATLLVALSGIPLAYLLARTNFRGKSWVTGLINLPIVIPHTAAGIALLLVFGRQSFMGKYLGSLGISFVDDLPGIVIGMAFVSLPFLVSSAREAFELVDPELERIALTEGASAWQAFYRVTLPLAWRGVVAGALMMWGRGISEFGAIVILAYHPKTIPVLVYERFYSFGLAAAQPVSVLLILASLLVFLLVQVMVRLRDQA